MTDSGRVAGKICVVVALGSMWKGGGRGARGSRSLLFRCSDAEGSKAGIRHT